MMAPIRRMVLDVLKPHDPPIRTFAQEVSDIDGVTGVNAILLEVDEEVENIKLTIAGNDIPYDDVKEAITDLGGSVHSMDEIVCGEDVVEESRTPQD